ncbi:MAG: Uma2 family endonuclease [Xenococcaceae cyanobacterium MO_188.B32]|nr:Uma2 family endonuclease [Xenococcaceae cyanobacterium MO_188.B32]
MRSTTLTNSPLAGKEPDVSFAFGERKSTPDLAIEVVYSSGGITDLEKYKYLGVKEVWFWQNNEMSFYKLVDSSYNEIHKSNYLPKLTPLFLVKFVNTSIGYGEETSPSLSVNRGLTESPLTIEADFVKQLNSLD